MANQIVNVVRNDALRTELHANAYREYQKLSWHSAAERMLDWYNHHARTVEATA
jgi:glycosyltransferase involved in cell wall biosynthesis